MTYDEFSEFIMKITSYYPYFKLEEYQLKYWFKELAQYKTEDLEKKFNYHLEGEYCKNAPTLNYLIKNLSTIKEQENQETKYIPCPFCKRLYEYPNQNLYRKKCYARCSTLDYINRMVKKFDIDCESIFGTNPKDLKISEINLKYLDFLLEVKKHSSEMSDLEKKVLGSTIKSFPAKQEKLGI